MAFDIILPYQDLQIWNLVWDYIGSPASTTSVGGFIQPNILLGVAELATEPLVEWRIFTKRKTMWLRNTAWILTEKIFHFMEQPDGGGPYFINDIISYPESSVLILSNNFEH